MKGKKIMAEVDQKIISNFLCTHRRDSIKVDLDPYLSENDLIFFPVKDLKEIKLVHGVNMDRYLERMRDLFSPYREKN